MQGHAPACHSRVLGGYAGRMQGRQPMASLLDATEKVDRSRAASNQHRHHRQHGDGGGSGRRHTLAALVGLYDTGSRSSSVSRHFTTNKPSTACQHQRLLQTEAHTWADGGSRHTRQPQAPLPQPHGSGLTRSGGAALHIHLGLQAVHIVVLQAGVGAAAGGGAAARGAACARHTASGGRCGAVQRAASRCARLLHQLCLCCSACRPPSCTAHCQLHAAAAPPAVCCAV